jgi:hypothetical protein
MHRSLPRWTSLPLFAALLALAVGLAACDSLVDQQVRSQVSSSYLQSAEGFNSAVNGAYASLRTWYAKEIGGTMTVFGTDTYQQGSDGSWKHYDSYTGQLSPTDGFAEDLWSSMYEGINTANTVINRSGNIEGLSEDVVSQRVAEAKFIRAHHYFVLVRTYGPVHLTTEETEGVETEASRAPIADVYSQIVTDLRDAIDVLPVEAEQYGRATKPAAEHLLSKVLLARGYSEAAQSSDWADAESLAETVINNYDFRLLEDFGDVFALDNQQNDEVIWAVQYDQNQLINGDGNNFHLYFLMEYDVRPGMSRNVRDGRPWKRFRPTEFTLDSLMADRTNDVRWDRSFKDVFISNNPGTYTCDGVECTIAEGDTALYFPGYEMPQSEQEERDYMVYTPSEYTDKVYPTLTKHLDPNRPTINDPRGSRDFLAMRLAETHLIAAEAEFQQSKMGQAADHINNVRLRAARESVPGSEAAMRISESDVDLDLILNERGRELLGEMKRWFDLVRTDQLVNRVRNHNPFGASNIEDHHNLRPIPQSQRDRTEGEFSQNPGYGE